MNNYYLDLHFFGEGMGGESEGSTESAVATQETVERTGSDNGSNEETFADLIAKGGKYHEDYSKSVQKVIDKKTGKLRSAEEKLAKYQNIGSLLASKYGINDINDIDGISSALEADNSMFEDKAMELGLTVEQYRHIQKTERELAQLKAERDQAIEHENAQRQLSLWNEKEEEVRQNYPDFNFHEELQNPQFERLIRAGVDMEQAYVALHSRDILSGAMQYTAQTVAKKTSDNIVARGSRPMEGGMSRNASATTRADISNLTKSDRAEMLARALAGRQTYRFS